MDVEPYKTSDTPFAAYLYMNGMQILTVVPDPNDYKRLVFVFLDEDDRPLLEDKFKADDGEFKKYYKSLRIVTRYINDHKQKQN